MPDTVQQRSTKAEDKKNDTNPGAVFNPRIPELMVKETGKYLNARVLAARAHKDDAWRHRTRIALVDAQHRKAPLWVCAACGVTVRLAASREKRFFFRHSIEDGRCPYVTRKGMPDDVRAAKYDAAKESDAHIQMKQMLVDSLISDPSFSHNTIMVESTWKAKGDPSRRRRPDVQAEQNGLRIAFEVQLSSTLIDEAVARRNFYLEEGGLLVWIFQQVETEDPRLYQGDILFLNSGNLFVIDDETVKTSQREGQLYLRNYHLIPEAVDDCIRNAWSSPQLVPFDSLTLDPATQRIFLFDYDREEEKLKMAMKEELEKEVRSRFLEFWRKNEPLQREHQIYDVADQYQDLRQYMESHGCPMPQDNELSLDQVATFIYLALSAINGVPAGSKLGNNLSLWNLLFKSRKEFVWYFAVLLSQHDRLQSLRDADTKARSVRPTNGKGERIKTFQEKLEEVRDGVVLTEEHVGPFAPSRDVAKLAAFIFPDTPQFRKFATEGTIRPKQ